MISAYNGKQYDQLHQVKSNQLFIICYQVQYDKGIQVNQKKKYSLDMVNPFLFRFDSLKFKYMEAFKCIYEKKQNHQIF